MTLTQLPVSDGGGGFLKANVYGQVHGHECLHQSLPLHVCGSGPGVLASVSLECWARPLTNEEWENEP